MNLETDLLNSKTIITKCKNKVYAQNLYAALCNNRFLKDGHEWSCSWRTSGGIVADLRDCGENYMDWYCSGLGDNPDYMTEGCISNEIATDLLSIGWTFQPINIE